MNSSTIITDITNCILKHKLIVIMRNIDEDYALSIAQALYEGGVRLVEVTFDQKSGDDGVTSTYRAIKSIKDGCPKDMYVGAGTVLTETQMRTAVDAGAEYIISPNTNVELIKLAKNLGLVSIPGAFTPTEIELAYSAGADFIKLFPADILGLAYAKSIMAPLNHIPMLAVGGVDLDTLGTFLSNGFCGVGIGGNIIRHDLIKNREFDKLTELASRYTQAIAQCSEKA